MVRVAPLVGLRDRHRVARVPAEAVAVGANVGDGGFLQLVRWRWCGGGGCGSWGTRLGIHGKGMREMARRTTAGAARRGEQGAVVARRRSGGDCGTRKGFLGLLWFGRRFDDAHGRRAGALLQKLLRRWTQPGAAAQGVVRRRPLHHHHEATTAARHAASTATACVPGLFLRSTTATAVRQIRRLSLKRPRRR